MNEWKPTEPQVKALQSTCYETLYGGSRGGGKTDTGLVWLLKPYLLNNANVRALVIRKNSDDLADWIDRANRLYSRYGAVITGKPATIKFPSGYKIRTGHLKDDNAYTKYQGQEFQRMVIEELTQIAQETNYLKLLGSCRSTISGIDARIFATTNPGGVGHAWVKKRFIDPAPYGVRFASSDSGRSRVFIPARLEDNPHLTKNDPDYVKYLEGLKETDLELYKAWRLGDWDTFAGQFFREFRRGVHTVKPFQPKKELPVVGGLDWGRTEPFCFLGAVATTIKYYGLDRTNPESIDYKDYTFTRVFVFQEVYGTDKLPREWGEIIKQRINLDNLKWIECDNMIFNPQNDGSISIADQFYDYDKRYRGKLSMQAHTQINENKSQRVNRAENVHKWLSFAPDGLPYLLIGENCQNLIRTLPELVHDEVNVEDVDQQGEDHSYDALAYMLKRIRWIDAKLGGVQRKGIVTPTIRRVTPDRPMPLNEWV